MSCVHVYECKKRGKEIGRMIKEQGEKKKGIKQAVVRARKRITHSERKF